MTATALEIKLTQRMAAIILKNGYTTQKVNGETIVFGECPECEWPAVLEWCIYENRFLCGDCAAVWEEI